MQPDTLAHLAGWLLTVLGGVYIAYPALRGRLRAPLTRALVAGLAGGLALAVSLALLIAPVVTLLWVASVGAGTLVPSNVVLATYGGLIGSVFGVGVVAGFLAGVASAVERLEGPWWRRDLALAAGWSALAALAVVAYVALGPAVPGPFSVAIVVYSLIAGTLIAPPSLTARRQTVLVVGLPLAFLLLSLGTKLAAGTGGAGRLGSDLLVGTLVVLAATTSFVVLTFVLSRPPLPTDQEASMGRFLAGVAIGLALAIVPAALNALLIGGDRNLAYLTLGIANVVAVLNGEARLLLHTPRARFLVSGPRTRLVKGIAIRRFRRGAFVGATLSLLQVVLAIAVMLLVAPAGGRPVDLLVLAAYDTPPFVGAWALTVGVLNVVLPLLVARLERLPAERFVVPGIVMVAAGAFIVDHEALLRLVAP